MTKREKKRHPVRTTRKYRSRVERERRQLRYIMTGIGVVAAICVVLLLAGLYKTQIADPAATRRAKEALKTVPAVTINDTMISIADWQARVRFERLRRINQMNQINQQMNLFDPQDQFGQQMIEQGRAQLQEITNLLNSGEQIAADALDQMVEEQLIREEATRRGITVTPEELQEHIEVDLFAYPYPPTPEPVPTLPAPTLAPTVTVTPAPTVEPTPLPTARSREDFEANYENYTTQVQEITEMSEEAWRSMIEAQLYRQKLLEAFEAQVETNVQQIQGSYIVAQDQETANELLARLEAGESFEALAEEIQADQSETPLARAGRISWSPRETIQARFGEEFATVAFDTAAGNYAPQIIPALEGQFYLVYVEENEVRELADYQIEQQSRELFQSWLDQEKQSDSGNIVYGNWREHVPLEPSL